MFDLVQRFWRKCAGHFEHATVVIHLAHDAAAHAEIVDDSAVDEPNIRDCLGIRITGKSLSRVEPSIGGIIHGRKTTSDTSPTIIIALVHFHTALRHEPAFHVMHAQKIQATTMHRALVRNEEYSGSVHALYRFLERQKGKDDRRPRRR